MITFQMLMIPRILLDLLVILNRFEDDLTKAVEISDIDHLAIEELAHESACDGLVMDLVGRIGQEQQALPSRLKSWSPYHCPAPDVVLDHEILCHWCRDVDHVITICGFIHSLFLVAADREA
jgi:hypothetical protein